ncbi:MAG TPA: hypothetical protein VGO85_01890 [Caldimonas sp.]|jgi:hypothetical protein|nr:hypothetical protein [Caldimonas sp.]
MRHRCVALLLALVLCATSATTPAQTAADSARTRFDGDWLVTMSCPNNSEKSAARGYKRQFPARVEGGVLHGETGVADAPGWLRLDGRIGADGSALIDANGRTGDPDYAVSHPPAASSYAFHVEARFDDARGTGKRLEQRVCSFVFERK